MRTGTVKWFDPKKHYGFIIEDVANEDNQDVFVAEKNIVDFPAQVLEEGDKVSYETEKTKKGWNGLKVTITKKHKTEEETEENK